MINSLIDRRFGDYQIQEKIGSGGMATVFKAVHKDSLQELALKILHEHYNDNPQIRLRFEREARISSRLKHPHIVPILDFGKFKGNFYLVMPFMEGGSLAAVLADKAVVKHSSSLEMLSTLASALDYAHQQGVIHRDFKLENILIGKHNIPAISDFGIAQASDVTSITMTGQLLGSPQYFAPENLENPNAIDYRLDLYSFAVVAYLMLTGYFPFTGPNALSIIYQHRVGDIPLPTKVDSQLPPALDEIFSKALAKNPDERFSSAHELVSQLDSAFVNLVPGAASIFMNQDNPLAPSALVTTPPSIQDALNPASKLAAKTVTSTRPMLLAQFRSAKGRKIVTPLFVGGWLFTCLAFSLGTHSLISGLITQAENDEQNESKVGATVPATETIMLSETEVFTVTVTTEGVETEQPTASKTATLTSSANPTEPANQGQSLPTAMIPPTEYVPNVTSPNQNPTVVNQAGNTQVPIATNLVPTNPPPTNQPANNPAPTSFPPTSVPPTNRPPTNVPATSVPPTSIPPTNRPPTNVPATSVPPTNRPPTNVPATSVPPTSIPPTSVPPTNLPLPTIVPPTNLPLPTNVPATSPPPTEDSGGSGGGSGRGGRGGSGGSSGGGSGRDGRGGSGGGSGRDGDSERGGSG